MRSVVCRIDQAVSASIILYIDSPLTNQNYSSMIGGKWGLSFSSHIQFYSFRGKGKLSDFNSPSPFIVSIVWATPPNFLQPSIENIQSSHSFLSGSSGTSLPVLPVLTVLVRAHFARHLACLSRLSWLFLSGRTLRGTTVVQKGRKVCHFRHSLRPNQKSTIRN
jgi:hypothetical protein